MTRDQMIQNFIRPYLWDDIQWLPQDASFRRYGRINTQTGFVLLMDGPPQKVEGTQAFVRYSHLLRGAGLHAPEIFKEDAANGLLILEYLGDTSFSQCIEGDPSFANTERIYRQLSELLCVLHTEIRVLPDQALLYDARLLRNEAALFPHWYAPIADLPIDSEGWKQYWALMDKHLARLDQHPKAFVLRDCHLDNFIHCANHAGLDQIGVIDFQDGGWGSALYDMTSLLFDARRDIPDELRNQLMQEHASFLEMPLEEYLPLAYFLVFQRALKVLGVFARLAVRDQKYAYVKHLPRCWEYIDKACTVLPDLNDWLETYCPKQKRGLQLFYEKRFACADSAMLFAAGKGTRMGQQGEKTPKPLLPVAGKPIIRHSKEALKQVGVSRFVVNAHHLAEQVQKAFADDADTQVVYERTLWETGGGVRHALPYLERESFWVVNGDSLWRMPTHELQDITALFFEKIYENKSIPSYDCPSYDCLGGAVLMLVPLERWYGKDARADFCFADDEKQAKIVRATDKPQKLGYGYAGVMYLHRAAIAGQPIEHFSLNRIFERLIAEGRLWGKVIDGDYFHVGTPEALEQADQEFRLL